ncbi:MAG: branched-chain amino acid ABC transporter permease [Clostridiales bacterium]|nr:branched-chain amino acid ABC transporter permease [Clostridiales bacterium]MDR2752333.1 branched-chain amino acid ABC transporter permease [Clostridiales bacterium]
METAVFVQHMVNGLSLGSLFALVAIGYTMVYTILSMINFAHGDIFMMSIYFAFFAVSSFHMPWVLALFCVIATTPVIGALIERFAYRPLRDAPKNSVLISAIGASFLLENAATYLFGGRPKALPDIPVLTRVITIQSVNFQVVSIVIPIITFVLLAVLLNFINRTKTGIAMRAVAQDYEIARVMGVNINWIISLTFIIGSALAAVGGFMWGVRYPGITPTMGVMPGLKCFVAAVVGGIGDIKGAVVGGFILGLGEIMIVALFPGISGYRDAFAFVLLIVILLVKPTGILGSKAREKV